MHDNRKQRVASKNLQAKKRVKQLQETACWWPFNNQRARAKKGEVTDEERWVIYSVCIFASTDSYEMAVMKLKLALDTSNVESEDQGETQRDSIVNVQRITIAWESKARKRLFSPGPSFGTMESFLDLAVSIERLYPEKERIEAENRKLKQKVTKLKQKLNNRIWRLPDISRLRPRTIKK
ncbi:unnamed protein product [Mytilus edulis]|uniref:Uncharacterized protein n=1 Tax=Mytilus edulis TaxID=6550 RepID=A0A8S3U4Y7_MYTED|nr:unnamed protein product [Mytilus edulis]